jgi:rhodanese-related sulfurtransferase
MDELITFASSHAMLSAAWGAIVVLIIFTTIKIKMSPIKQISTQDMTFLINRQDGLVVDIRAEKDFKANHIVDAKYLSPEKITDNDFSSLEKHKDKPIIVVCTAGMSAVKVANQLYKDGFTQTSLLKGGMNSWVNAGLPVTKK